MTTSCIVVEDEPLARERLAGYVRRLPYLALLAEFDEAPAALAFLKARRVDLVFLDIGLGGLSGIELLETTAVTSPVILTTAHPEFALRAYDLKVVDYLLKPFTFERFVQAVERLPAGRPEPAGPGERPFFFVKTEHRLERVLLAEVLVIEGQGDYRLIHTLTRRLLTLETFAELEARLPPERICRVHKSYMVALDKIESIERDRIQIRGQRIALSPTYRERFYRLIGRPG